MGKGSRFYSSTKACDKSGVPRAACVWYQALVEVVASLLAGENRPTQQDHCKITGAGWVGPCLGAG